MTAPARAYWPATLAGALLTAGLLSTLTASPRPAQVPPPAPATRAAAPAPEPSPSAPAVALPSPAPDPSPTPATVPEPWYSPPAPFGKLSECESHRTWDADTGNGYFGGLQWALRTWWWLAPDVLGEDPPHPTEATPQQEVAVARYYVELEREQGRGGYGPWPGCAAHLGLPR